MLSAFESDLTVTSGQRAVLNCRFNLNDRSISVSSSVHQLIWIRQAAQADQVDVLIAHNQDVLIADSRFIVQQTDIDYTLIILDTNIDDEGVYACEINSQPVERAPIHLHIQGKVIYCDNERSHHRNSRQVSPYVCRRRT